MTHEYKQFYRRKLPHRHSPGSTLFVTYRLLDSVPRTVIDQWKEEIVLLEREKAKLRRDGAVEMLEFIERSFRRRWFGKFEDALHLEKGPLWLKDPRIAEIIARSLHHLNRAAYRLHAYCVMANHVHSLFTPFLDEKSLCEVPGPKGLKFETEDRTLDSIMQSLKGYTAREANKVLSRRGQFWDPESYDHEVRNMAEFERIKRYILNNPVKAGLVRDWREWKWSCVEP